MEHILDEVLGDNNQQVLSKDHSVDLSREGDYSQNSDVGL